MTEHFVFPYNFQDLAEETTDNRYRVRSVDYIESLDDRKIRKKLEEIERDLLYTWNKIRDPNVFDFIYFFIRLIDKDQTQVAPESLQYLSEVLVNALDKLINAVNSETRKDNRNAETLDDMCNSLKMIVFLMLYFLHVTCVKKAKNSLKDELNELSAKDKNAPSKKNPKKKISSKDLSKDTVVMLLKQHADCLSVLRTVLTLNLRFLWQKKQIDDEFYRYFLDLALKMLESRQLLKDYKPSKEDIFSILELTLADNSGALKNAELKLINLIYEEELLVEPISDFIIKAYRSSQVNISKLATDTLSMLVSYILERTNVNAESQAVKNTRDFLCRVAQHIPRAFNTNLSLFICLYESEAYLLRNALTDILTEIIKQVLTPKEGEEIDLDNEEKHKKAKIRLLDKLVKRTTDKHAYSRSHLLKALVDLCSSNVVPKQYLQILLLKGCERIKDVSANVRKKALELLDKVIRMYYSIFVGNSDSGFMSVPELQRQTKFNTEETKNLERDVKALQEKLKDHLEESDEYSEIQSEIKIHQRKLESIKNNQDNIGEYINMLESLEKILPNLLQLLGSKNLGDVTETIKLFVTLKLFKVSFAEAGIKKMLVLIWSKEKTVLEELLKAYWKLYFDPKAFSSEQIAWNLINLYTAANLTEKTSLEELILTVLDVAHDEKDQKLREDYTFHGPVFKILWNIFLAGFHKMEKEIAIEDQEGPSKDKISTRNALTLLRVANVRKKEILESRFDSFNVILNSFLKNNNPDWIFLKEISHMVEKSKEASPRVNQMIKSMLLLMIKWHGTVNNEWFCAAEQVTNMIFALKQNPEILVQYFIVQCSRFMLADGHSKRGASNLRSPNIEPPISPMNMNNREGDSHGFLGNTQKLEEDLSRIDNGMSNDQTNYNYEEKFCQLIFLVGHVSVKFLLHFDIIENQFKKLKNEAETKMQADQKDNDAENELEKIGGGVEADFEHKISILHNISESCIVFKNLLAAYVPYMKAIIMEMINKKGSTRNPVVERAVVLSVCKYMCTSNEFCQENLNLLFALLKCKIDPITKTNIIIALGDLIHRYPNTTEPYTPNLYKNLQDENANVRKTTLLVITHLILNDMLKLKAEISDIALLFEDPDQRIQNLVKLFFHELHKKDSKTIYNLLPEAIGRLSRMEKVDEAVFQNFAKNVMQYLEKEKYSESLVEKLCARFSNTENEKEWRNTAFCLHLLSYNEKGLRKLIDMFDFYRDKLNDPTINEYFHAILVKMKKFNKPEVKTLLEEWESKLSNNSVEEGGEERKRKIPENKRKPSKKTKLRGKSTQEMISEDADDSDNQSRVSSRKPSQKVVNSQRSLENSNSLPMREKKDRAAKQKERRRNIVYEDDDDEGDFIVPDEEFDMIEEAA